MGKQRGVLWIFQPDVSSYTKVNTLLGVLENKMKVVGRVVRNITIADRRYDELQLPLQCVCSTGSATDALAQSE